jgi:hypothetical protein
MERYGIHFFGGLLICRVTQVNCCCIMLHCQEKDLGFGVQGDIRGLIEATDVKFCKNLPINLIDSIGISDFSDI